jgi:hypothetical protein
MEKAVLATLKRHLENEKRAYEYAMKKDLRAIADIEFSGDKVKQAVVDVIRTHHGINISAAKNRLAGLSMFAGALSVAQAREGQE